jgi:chitin synthase
MSKAFEALFGCVTCLPGCFTMYRIRNAIKNKPVLVCNEIISSYSESKVDTLHLKNLLELGEDRYLTTLMLKTHPMMKTSFNVDAKCSTVAPDRWSILLSQRRRWINSTVHNLFELMMVKQLCGFCFFSMRFIVIVDLFGTMVQPAALLYVGYLAYVAATDTTSVFPMVSLIMIGCIYGFQILIILFKREFHHLGWIILYILAIPLFRYAVFLYILQAFLSLACAQIASTFPFIAFGDLMTSLGETHAEWLEKMGRLRLNLTWKRW